MEVKWIEGYDIKVTANSNEVVISANAEGLLSLSNVLATIASENVLGAHIHLDQYNSLDDGSVDLIIEKE